MRILFLCTGNSCRSQMAEGMLRSIDRNLTVFSAGTIPVSTVHPKAIAVMKEIGIDLSAHTPKNVDQFITQSFDYVVTVCDHANERCPVFLGNVTHRIHIGFKDPAEEAGTEDEQLVVFRNLRDEIKSAMHTMHRRILSFTSDRVSST